MSRISAIKIVVDDRNARRLSLRRAQKKTSQTREGQKCVALRVVQNSFLLINDVFSLRRSKSTPGHSLDTGRLVGSIRLAEKLGRFAFQRLRGTNYLDFKGNSTLG
jgi:hypothetical protein